MQVVLNRVIINNREAFYGGPQEPERHAHIGIFDQFILSFERLSV